MAAAIGSNTKKIVNEKIKVNPDLLMASQNIMVKCS